jgi:DNA-binding PadR family transcriptional regulator
MTEKQIDVLRLLIKEGGKAAHYFVTQLCGLYADPDDTLYSLQKDGYITSVTVRRSSTYSITEKGRDAVKQYDEPAAPEPAQPAAYYTDLVNRKAQLTAHIERLDRERESLVFELSQLTDEDEE